MVMQDVEDVCVEAMKPALMCLAILTSLVFIHFYVMYGGKPLLCVAVVIRCNQCSR